MSNLQQTCNKLAITGKLNINRQDTINEILRKLSVKSVDHLLPSERAVVDVIMSMPPAEPEIICCKDCKYAEVADPEDGQDGYTCQFHRGSIWFSGSYCSWAERKQDEQIN